MRIGRVGAAAAAIAAAAATAGCGPRTPPPNVMLIVLDTVRADSIGVRLDGRAVTPNIDRITAEATRFTTAYSAAPWTLPSHASMFTGLLPHRHRAVHERFQLDGSLTTLAEILDEAGYQTAGFTTNPWLHARGGMAQGFSTYSEVFKAARDDGDKGGERATDLVRQWLSGRDPKRPFFVFVNYIEAHLPLEPPAEVCGRFASLAIAGARTTVTVDQAERVIAGNPVVAPDDLRRLYLTEVAYLDDLVGALVAALRSIGDLDNTLLVITSDHGEHLGEHLLVGHEFSVFEELLRVPLIIRYPAAFTGGEIRNHPVSLLDLTPTVVDLTGCRLPPGLDGTGLHLTPEANRGGRPILAEYSRPRRLIEQYWRSKHPDVDMSAYDRSLRALRDGPLKLITSSRGEVHLFDVTADPRETRDLAPSNPERVRALTERMNEMVSGER